MDTSYTRHNHFVGIWLRGFFTEEIQKHWKSLEPRFYGLEMAVQTESYEIVQYLMQTHYYLWDKDSIIHTAKYVNKEDIIQWYKDFISKYILSLSEDEQIEFL